MTRRASSRLSVADTAMYYRPDTTHRSLFTDPLVDVTALPKECSIVDYGNGSKGISVVNRHNGVEIYNPSVPGWREVFSPCGHVLIPHQRLNPTKKCCFFMSFLDYIVYKTHVSHEKNSDLPQSMDCIVVCSPEGFAEAMLDQEVYLTTYCFLPNDMVGKTMLATLQERYGHRIVDMSKMYYFVENLYEYMKIKNKY